MQSLFNLGFVVSLKDHVSGALKHIEGNLGHLNETVKQTRNWREAGINMAEIGVGAVAMGGAAALALKSVLEPAMAMQGVMAHVATAVNDGAEQTEHLRQVMEMADEVASRSVVTDEQLAQAYYLARSNMLSHERALEAVRAATILVQGTTENAAAAQASMGETTRTLTALMFNLGGSAEGWGDFLALLQTKYAFSNINEITEALKYAVPTMAAFHISSQQTAAALAGLSAAGIHSQQAGVAFRQFVSKFAAPKESLAPFVAYNKEGLDVLTTLANISKAVHALPVPERGGFLKGLGFELRSLTGVALLSDKTQLLGEVEADMYHAAGYSAEASAKRMSALDEQLTVARNNWMLLKEAIGVALLPSVATAVGAMTRLVQSFRGVAEAHPTLVKLAVGFTAIAAAVLIPVGSLLIFTGGLIAAASYLPGIALIGTAFAAIAAPIWAATAAVVTFLATNPIGWAILAGAAAVAIYQHWDSIKAYFGTFAADIWKHSTWAQAAWAAVKPFFVAFWNDPKRAFSDFLSWLTDWASKLPSLLYDAGAGLVKGLADGIMSGAHLAVEAVKNIAGTIKDYFVAHSPPTVGPLRELAHVRIVQTIAEMMDPGPVIAASRRVAAAVAIAMPLTFAPMTSAAAMPALTSSTSPITVPLPAAAPYRGHSTVHLTYSPTITVNGDADRDDIKRLLDQHADDLLRKLRDEQERAERTAY